MRLAILPPIAVVALLSASPAGFAGTAVMVAVAVAWTCAYGWWLSRGGTAPAVVDGAVLLVLCLSVFWTDAAATSNSDWLRVLVTVACVTWQWHTPAVTGFVVAVVVSAGMIIIFAMAGLTMNGVPGWTIAMAGGSRAAWVLVFRAAERADRTAAEAERARREAAVAEAERAEERELANSLHDTAATTLLMVGTGQVPSGASWLAPQARRDLDQLRSYDGKTTEQADLVDLLRAGLDTEHLTVDFTAPQRLPLRFDVASAIAGAAREALNNVRRHAGTDRATVRLHGDPDALRVEIADEGRGFTVTGATATRRGLRESVHGRMNRIGGAATVTSAEGSGTVVRLVWSS
ncbi:sensor histidine kinase [Amycolatopsis sp. YIM 10]|uniref:sensor histidine kinase n=1 Tax=Amycolatopsis sp. YIM 10 TaxID=2653857 RepID=UPI0012904C23|nr:ATP-binding protein [Amycolatopsis sp. YIM 10]